VIAFANTAAATYKAHTMNKSIFLLIAAVSAVLLPSCTDQSSSAADATAAPWECIAAEVTIGTNSIDTVVRFNKVNGEAQLLNAASFASKATGAQGNVVGWVPLGDLRSAVQELVQREQAAQQQMPAAPATPEATPEETKKK
jgi:predicted xylose isomerase-like sugar epimerase